MSLAHTSPSWLDRRRGIILGVVLVALALLAVDHWAHIFGLLPYLLLVAC